MFLFEIPLFLERRRERRSKRRGSSSQSQVQVTSTSELMVRALADRPLHVSPLLPSYRPWDQPSPLLGGHPVKPSGSASNWHVRPVHPVIGQKSVQEAMADLRRLGEMRDEILAAQAEVKALADELAKRQQPS